MGVVFKHHGNFNKTEKFLRGYSTSKLVSVLNRYGQEGVNALASATPVDSGVTASSWGYKTVITPIGFSIQWTNSNAVAGVPLVILLQYGHGTRGGGFVAGRDFINPSIKGIMDSIAEAVWQEVVNL